MLEGQGAIIDFRDVLSIADPVVRNVLDSCLSGGLARVPIRQFRLTPRIMVLLFDKGATAAVTDVLRRLRHKLEVSHSGRLQWKIYDLRSDGVVFRAECRKAAEAERLSGHDEASLSPDNDRLGALLHIIDALHTIDLAAHIRRQVAIRIGPDKKRKTEFEECWVNLASLEQAIGLPIRNDSWKFAHVTEFLDFKVLDYVTRDWTGDHAMSVNFHCINVVAPQFSDLIFRLPPVSRNNLIFELSVSEYLHDQAKVAGATAKLRDDGFRVAIDGVSVPVLDQVTGFFPEVQYVKMPWSDALTRLNPDQQKRLKEVIGTHKGETFVLSRCGRPEDVEVGRSLGFSAFQGWGVPAVPAVQPKAVTAPLQPVEPKPEPHKSKGIFGRIKAG